MGVDTSQSLSDTGNYWLETNYYLGTFSILNFNVPSFLDLTQRIKLQTALLHDHDV